MCNRHWILVVGLVSCACLAIQITGRLAAQQNGTACQSDKDSDQEKEQKKELEVDLKYAKAYLGLMEATLGKYQDMNRRQRNTIPAGVIEVVQGSVREASDRMQLLQKGNLKYGEICVAAAESELRSAQESLQKAEQVNRASAGTVSGPQVELLKAEIELAKIRVEKARELVGGPPLATVRYELGQLNEQVRRLQITVALLRQIN